MTSAWSVSAPPTSLTTMTSQRRSRKSIARRSLTHGPRQTGTDRLRRHVRHSPAALPSAQRQAASWSRPSMWTKTKARQVQEHLPGVLVATDYRSVLDQVDAVLIVSAAPPAPSPSPSTAWRLESTCCWKSPWPTAKPNALDLIATAARRRPHPDGRLLACASTPWSRP